MKARSALQDLAKTYGIDREEVLAVTKDGMENIGPDDEELELDDLKKKSKALALFLARYPDLERDFRSLRGSLSHWGKHAGGVLISDVSLQDQLPVRRVDGNIVSCWTEGLADRELGRMGFIKMDLLGIDVIKIVSDTIALIEKTKGVKLETKDIPLTDKKALSFLNKNDGIGVFQFDSDLAYKVIKDMGGVKSFDDLVALTALMRPASLQNKFPKLYGNRASDPPSYCLPECLHAGLGDTYGLPIYQEGAYHVGMNMANFDIVSAYKFMKLLYKGKMTGDKIPYWRKKFLDGCEEKIIKCQYKIELVSGDVVYINKGAIVMCIDGVERTIEEVLDKGYELDDGFAKGKDL